MTGTQAVTIETRDEHDRPRERLLDWGAAALTDVDLVAAILGTGTAGADVIETSGRLARTVNLRRLHLVPVEDLLAIRGLGPARTAQLLAAAELGRRLWPDGDAAPLVRGPEQIYDLTRDIRSLNREHFVGFYLNSRHQVLRRDIISIGSLNASIVHPREVYLPAIAVSAASLVLAHNHPSGDPTPSEEDMAITRRLQEAGRLLGIELVDHVVVARESYASFRERRLLRG
jgi:DNA repair protein RadC